MFLAVADGGASLVRMQDSQQRRHFQGDIANVSIANGLLCLVLLLIFSSFHPFILSSFSASPKDPFGEANRHHLDGVDGRYYGFAGNKVNEECT